MVEAVGEDRGNESRACFLKEHAIHSLRPSRSLRRNQRVLTLRQGMTTEMAFRRFVGYIFGRLKQSKFPYRNDPLLGTRFSRLGSRRFELHSIHRQPRPERSHQRRQPDR